MPAYNTITPSLACSAHLLAERLPSNAVAARSIAQGWSLQSCCAPYGTLSCGNGSFCPSSLKCNPAVNGEVAACCVYGDCRDAVKSAPSCADSTWSLWEGLYGNSFCCADGMFGVYDHRLQVAGTCVSPAAPDATLAVLMSTCSSLNAVTSTSAPDAVISSLSIMNTLTAAKTTITVSATVSFTVAGISTSPNASTPASVTDETSGAGSLAISCSIIAFGFLAMLAL